MYKIINQSRVYPATTRELPEVLWHESHESADGGVLALPDHDWVCSSVRWGHPFQSAPAIAMSILTLRGGHLLSTKPNHRRKTSPEPGCGIVSHFRL